MINYEEIMEKDVLISAMEELLRCRKNAQRSVLSQSSLHIGQPEMLFYIHEHPGCSQKQIADEIHVTPASVATSLKRLEKNRLITRRADTADTRCNRVYITQAGERELDFCCNGLEQIDNVLTNLISDDEMRIMESLLSRMRASLKIGK